MTDINDILKIKTNNIGPSKGKILISEPFLSDYYFKRSVVLLAEHNDDGTFGLILNKPVNVPFNEAIKGFPQFKARVFLGGPVKTDSLFFIHTLGNLIDESLEIMPGLFWGGDIETVKELISINRVTTDQIKFFAGYSGWVSKQLEGELTRNSWVVSNIKPEQVMLSDPDTLWNNTLKWMGGDYAYWTSFPHDPAMN
ncbi:MAG: YqgE/AlgH family protein [Bacteroidales bacterium]|nr:YqgE/AlgH family protein [Bacteroidales bacterium]